METKQRRIRLNAGLRNLASSESLNSKKLIQPIFIVEGLKEKEKMDSLPGVFRDTESSVFKQVESDLKAGVTHFILFLFRNLNPIRRFLNPFMNVPFLL